MIFLSFVFVFALLCWFLFPIFKIFKNQNTLQANFFVVLKQTGQTQKSEAEQEAQSLKTRGGAGVLFFKNTFFVAISVYENEKDAISVVNKLKSEGQEFVVKKFVFKANIDDQNFFNFLTSVLKNLYELSILLESGQISPVAANLKLRNLLTQTTLTYEKANNCDNKIFAEIFLNTKSILEYATSFQLLDTSLLPYASVVRAAEIEILSVAAENEFF